MKIITVVAAIWQRADGRFFLAQRAAGQSFAGQWEFPGGKLEAQETEPQALAREMEEEFGVQAQIGPFFMESLHPYKPQKTIRLRAYWLASVQGEPQALEHAQLAWVLPQELLNYSLSQADIPVAKALLEQLD